MFTQSKKEEIIIALEAMKITQADPLRGICTNLSLANLSDYVGIHKWLRNCFGKWPEFSGSTSYPICTEYAGKSDYFDAIANNTVWDISTLYRQARMHLVDFLINELQIGE